MGNPNMCPVCRSLMTADADYMKKSCKNPNCGKSGPKRSLEEIEKESKLYRDKRASRKYKKYGKKASSVSLVSTDSFLETVLINCERDIICQDRIFKLSKRPDYGSASVNFKNKETGLYLRASKWNLPDTKYIEVPGDALTGINQFHNQILTFYLGDTPHDTANYDKFYE